jgi:hypothetical protein
METMTAFSGALTMTPPERDRTGTCMEHAHTLERLTGIETKNETIIRDIESIDVKLEAIFKLLRGRPSWAVLLIFSFFTTVIGILLTIVVSGQHMAK